MDKPYENEMIKITMEQQADAVQKEENDLYIKIYNREKGWSMCISKISYEVEFNGTMNFKTFLYAMKKFQDAIQELKDDATKDQMEGMLKQLKEHFEND